jgi:hypothetical protein
MSLSFQHGIESLIDCLAPRAVLWLTLQVVLLSQEKRGPALLAAGLVELLEIVRQLARCFVVDLVRFGTRSDLFL